MLLDIINESDKIYVYLNIYVIYFLISWIALITNRFSALTLNVNRKINAKIIGFYSIIIFQLFLDFISN